MHLKSLLLERQRQEDCEFETSPGKVSKILPKKQNTKYKQKGMSVWHKW
jgi:hypothetical protein